MSFFLFNKIRDTVTGGSVLASGAQPPASVTHFFQSSLYFGQKLIVTTDRVKYGGRTLPKNGYMITF